MVLVNVVGSEARFVAYVESVASVIGHKDRIGPLRDYCTGLMLPCERKSVEPMAAVTAPSRTAAQHQSLLHFVGEGGWSDERVLAKVHETVLPAIERAGPVEAWIIDDTGFPKQGRHSVGVARQYCGQLGKQDNCQVAVSLSLANRHASLPVAWRLYLPQEWAADPARRRKARVPADIQGPLMWVFVLAPLGLVMVLSFGINRLSAGTALALFFVYSGVLGLSLASIFLVYTHQSIMQVFFITAATFGAMSLYGYTTQRDLTGLGSFMFMGLIGIVIASLVNMFLHSSGLGWAISIIGVLVFVGLTAYDTQNIKEMYSPMDDGTVAGRKAIMGALRLYLDFINLFLMLLRLFGDRR